MAILRQVQRSVGCRPMIATGRLGGRKNRLVARRSTTKIVNG